MASKEELLALAERVEALAGPSREVDVFIACSAWPYRILGENIVPAPSGNGRCVSHYASGKHGTWLAPRYTASFDVALTLVPKGWHVGDLTECNEDNEPHCCLTENTEPCRDAVGNGADLVLSICAAALRAHAEIVGIDATLVEQGAR